MAAAAAPVQHAAALQASSTAAMVAALADISRLSRLTAAAHAPQGAVRLIEEGDDDSKPPPSAGGGWLSARSVTLMAVGGLAVVGLLWLKRRDRRLYAHGEDAIQLQRDVETGSRATSSRSTDYRGQSRRSSKQSRNQSGVRKTVRFEDEAPVQRVVSGGSKASKRPSERSSSAGYSVELSTASAAGPEGQAASSSTSSTAPAPEQPAPSSEAPIPAQTVASSEAPAPEQAPPTGDHSSHLHPLLTEAVQLDLRAAHEAREEELQEPKAVRPIEPISPRQPFSMKNESFMTARSTFERLSTANGVPPLASHRSPNPSPSPSPRDTQPQPSPRLVPRASPRDHKPDPVLPCVSGSGTLQQKREPLIVPMSPNGSSHESNGFQVTTSDRRTKRPSLSDWYEASTTTSSEGDGDRFKAEVFHLASGKASLSGPSLVNDTASRTLAYGDTTMEDLSGDEMVHFESCLDRPPPAAVAN
eukprot:TRINITY_DN34817_c0_g1_i1.p1 TRINITY_DN34817_c0_g1~~TRINITY_DN34817_c0_g1_i1.p1  ORF type:complete len:473 (-),score=84.75 TRINITY_DN34817_c0_g1_i1:276-1694(-)